MLLVSVSILGLAVLDGLGREGLRLGAWSPTPLSVVLLLVGLVVLGPALPWPAPRRPWAAALGLYVAVFALWTLAATRRQADAGGGMMRARVRGLSTQGTEERPVQLRRLRLPAGFAEECGRRRDVDLELSGVLEVPETGRYRFDMTCGGTCSLWLGERRLLQGTDRVTGETVLAAGSVPLQIRLQHPGKRASLGLDWDRPALLEASPLDEAVSLAALPAGTLRSRERRVVVRAALQVTAALAAGLLGLGLLRAVRLGLGGWRAAWRADPVRRQAVAVGAGALVLLAALHAFSAPRALPGGYLHPWTSEHMMQTVSVVDLQAEPLRSLFYLHIQPPLFDALRAGLVAANGPGIEGWALVRAVDHGLYVCWALAYGAAVGLVYAFMARPCGRRPALVGAGLFALHPATLFYATLLESTFVSALFVLWLGYELWRLGPGQGSLVRLAMSVVLLFFTRSVAQWPLLALLAVALWLRGCEWKRAMGLLAALGLVVGLFLTKQAAVFGLTLTSSFGPLNLCRSLSASCPGIAPVELPRALPPPSAASVLRRTEKLNGTYSYNQLAFLRRSFSQMEEYRAVLRRLSAHDLSALMAHNAAFWLQPSSRYTYHVLVDRLPWRSLFDSLLSGIPLVGLLCGATLVWLRSAWASRAALARGLGLALPGLYVATASIVFESGENMRFKFFVEPLLWVFLWSQGCHVWRTWRSRRATA